MPAGRPSLYQPEFCERIVDRQSNGWSLAEVAAEIGVSRQTLMNWADEHPEFLTAMQRAKAAEQAWFERVGREALFADKFQAAVWKKSVEARFRDDYTERRETELSGSVGIRHEDALEQLE